MLDAAELPWEGGARRALGRGGRRHCSARRPQAESAEIANRVRELHKGVGLSLSATAPQLCNAPRWTFRYSHSRLVAASSAE